MYYYLNFIIIIIIIIVVIIRVLHTNKKFKFSIGYQSGKGEEIGFT